MPAAELRLEQVLLTTLVVKLAVVAALATMLARYRRFRHILIFERRDWPDRLIFILFFGVPLAAGVGSRLLLNYQAADLSLEGAFVAGLVAGPYAGAVIGALVGVPPLANGELIALPGRTHSHSLKHCLQDADIPAWDRARLPLLVDADDAVLAAGDRVLSATFDAWLWLPASSWPCSRGVG